MKNAGVATWVGIAIGFLGPLLLTSPAARVFGDPDRTRTMLFYQLAMWAFAGAVLWIVLGVERRPLASIGLKPPGARSIAMGLALAAVIMWVLTPFNVWLLKQLGLAGFEEGIGAARRMPPWLLAFAVLTAGVVEEILYRGYPLERLAEITGSVALAGAITVLVFALVHWPTWGAGPVLTFVVSGMVVTGFYVWQRDLTATIVAHVVVDAMGLIVVPWLSRGAPGAGSVLDK
jgi:membrane protease YdiL (CAAX protease family)